MKEAGFLSVKKQVLECLSSGRVLHEPRADRESKNFLFMRVIGPGEVVEMIKGCSGVDHQSAPHHAYSKILIHILKPQGKYKGWYEVLLPGTKHGFHQCP